MSSYDVVRSEKEERNILNDVTGGIFQTQKKKCKHCIAETPLLQALCAFEDKRAKLIKFDVTASFCCFFFRAMSRANSQTTFFFPFI